MKDTSIPLDKFFQIIKPQYTYLKITPHKSIRNYNSSNIAKSIALSWKSINKVIRLEQKKLWVECNFKVSYIIDIYNNNANFYFIVPEIFKSIIVEKMKEIWSKATVEVVDPIQPLSQEATRYQVYYKKEDALSLEVDKKSNEPLNSILTVLDIMKEEDRITVCYNFHPTSQFGWQEKHDQTIAQYKAKKPVDKDKSSFAYIAKSVLNIIVEITETLIGTLNEFVTYKKNDGNKTLVESLATALDASTKKEISSDTKKKKDVQVIDTEIAIISQSNDRTREYNNLNSVCASYRTLDADNELQYKKLKKGFNLEDLNWNCIKSRFSVNECQNFIQIPGKDLLEEHKISFIQTEEKMVPEQLQHGTKRLGTNICKGKKTKAYLEDEYNIGNLPLVFIGSQGAGKSTLFANIAKDCSDANEGVILIDFIKNCELSETVMKYVPKDKVLEIDLAHQDTIQGFGYNEIEITNDIPAFEKLKLASLQAQQVMNLIDAISVGDPLSSRMRRYLNAAANVVLVQGYNSIKNVVECLEDYNKRIKYTSGLDKDLKCLLEDELNTLNELNEWSKPNKKERDGGAEAEIIGTYSSKIEHILDRIGMLREDFKMKYMYNKDLKDNINLVDCMEQGKIVIFKMREDEFQGKMIKNIMVTYLYTKIWLATQLRGKLHDKPLRCNVLVDEVFQSPQVLKMLEYILPQCRKFGLHNIFSTQYIGQLDCIFDALEASGASYMLLKGCLENDFNHFKGKLEGFTYEDLRDMAKTHQFPSLNLIYHSKGYASFITALPPKLK